MPLTTIDYMSLQVGQIGRKLDTAVWAAINVHLEKVRTGWSFLCFYFHWVWAPLFSTGRPNHNQVPTMDNYITGTKLFLVMLSVTLVAFLVLLDMVIIATVWRYTSWPGLEHWSDHEYDIRQFLALRVSFIPLKMSVGMAVRISWLGEYPLEKISWRGLILILNIVRLSNRWLESCTRSSAQRLVSSWPVIESENRA